MERLQNHILAREEAFTQEVLQQDEQLRALQAELDALRAAAATGAPVSASGATAAAAEASAAVGAADGGATASEAPADQRSDAQALANLQAVIEMLQTGSAFRNGMRELLRRIVLMRMAMCVVHWNVQRATSNCGRPRKHTSGGCRRRTRRCRTRVRSWRRPRRSSRRCRN